MKGRLPAEAFSFYVSLGPDRSYQAVADEFEVSKRTVVTRGKNEDWQSRVQNIETEARDRVDKKAVESLEEMGDRHLKILRVIQSKALQGLQGMSMTSAMDAVRALDLSVKAERIVRGEPGDRSSLSFEEIAKQQHERWLTDDDDSSTTTTGAENGGDQ